MQSRSGIEADDSCDCISMRDCRSALRTPRTGANRQNRIFAKQEGTGIHSPVTNHQKRTYVWEEVRLNSFRFIHTADLHLGTPFQSAARKLSPEWSQHLRVAVEQSFDRIVELAIREAVDFITIAGDLYDAKLVPLSVHLGLLRGFERLCAHAIPVFVSHGNHDPLVTPRPFDWPRNVRVFPAWKRDEQGTKPGATVPSFFIDVRGTRVQIAGFSYAADGSSESMADCFTRDTAADFSIALYHGMVGATSGHEPYCPTTVTALSARGFDFWGLGHIHQAQVLHLHRPTIVYPGNPQGRHMREEGWRGVEVVDVNSRGDVSLTRISTSVIRFETVEVLVDEVESVNELRDLAVSALAEINQLATGYALVVRVVLVGTSSIGDDGLDASAWQDFLTEEGAAKGWQVVIEDVSLRITPLLDIAALRRSTSYVGEVLRVLDEWRAEPMVAAKELATTLGTLFRPQSGWASQTASAQDIRDWCDSAERRLLRIYSETGMQS